MPPFPLTPTRDAAPCQTFLGRTGEAVVGAADGISGGRDGVTFTPPPFCKLIFRNHAAARPPSGCVGRICCGVPWASVAAAACAYKHFIIHLLFNN